MKARCVERPVPGGGGTKFEGYIGRNFLVVIETVVLSAYVNWMAVRKS